MGSVLINWTRLAELLGTQSQSNEESLSLISFDSDNTNVRRNSYGSKGVFQLPL